MSLESIYTKQYIIKTAFKQFNHTVIKHSQNFNVSLIVHKLLRTRVGMGYIYRKSGVTCNENGCTSRSGKTCKNIIT